MSDARSEALDWLSTFEAACRGRDFEAGRRLFAPDAVAFGTYATAVHGLDNIEREQWRQIWPRIRGFRFELTKVHGKPTAGILKDVVVVKGFKQIEVDVTPAMDGLTLFHCHQQLHMDYGFKLLFNVV